MRRYLPLIAVVVTAALLGLAVATTLTMHGPPAVLPAAEPISREPASQTPTEPLRRSRVELAREATDAYEAKYPGLPFRLVCTPTSCRAEPLGYRRP